MNREILDRWCERGILGLVLLILIYSPLAFAATRLQEFLVVQLLTLGVLGLWLARIWLSERPQFLFPPISWALFAFVAYFIGRYFTCDVEYVGRQELLRILVYASLFFAVLNNLHRQESTQVIALVLFGVGVFAAGYAVYQFVSGSDSVWGVASTYKGRGSGTYINPNHLAGLLEMLGPLSVAYLIVGRGKAVTRILLGYAACAMIAGVVATASRGSWASLGLALVIMGIVLLMQKSFRRHALVLLLVIGVGGFAALQKTDYFKKRIDKAFVGGKVDLQTRLVLWDTALKMWQDHFWVGVGPGHYDLRFRSYRPASVQLQPERAHNDYLNTLADLGLVGGILVSGLVSLLVWGVIKVWPHVKREERAFASNTSDKFAFVLGASMSFLALALHSILDFNLQVPANAIVAAVLLALLSSHLRFATDRFWFNAKTPLKLIASLLLLATISYLGWQEARLGREWLYLQKAKRAEPDSFVRAGFLKQAYQIESNNGETAKAIGEIYRLNSAEGGNDFAALAEQAVSWYQRGIANNPYDAENYLRWGMTLDFLGQHPLAEEKFVRADELDPNGYFVCAHMGRHYVESGEYAAARPWLERSLRLWPKENQIASEYLKMANERLLEGAQDPMIRMLREQMRNTNP